MMVPTKLDQISRIRKKMQETIWLARAAVIVCFAATGLGIVNYLNSQTISLIACCLVFAAGAGLFVLMHDLYRGWERLLEKISK